MFFLYVQQFHSYYTAVELVIELAKQEVQLHTIDQPYFQQVDWGEE